MSVEIIQCLYLGNMRDSAGTLYNEYERIINCLNLIEPVSDEGKVDTMVLEALSVIIHKALQSGERVLVHCGAGMQRSPLVVAWYLVRFGHKKSIMEAYHFINSKKPDIQIKISWLEESAVEKVMGEEEP